MSFEAETLSFESGQFEIAKRDGVGIIRLRFSRANAMGPDFLAGLDDSLDRVADTRALVLTAEGRSFSSGLDLPALLALDEASVRALIERFSRVMQRLFLWPKPTLCALNGHAIAGGFVLAMACDFRWAAHGASKFGMTGVRLGIAYPSLVTSMLQYALPKWLWHKLLLEGHLMSVDEASNWGVIDAVSGETLLEGAVAHAKRLADSDANAYARTKTMLKGDTVMRAEQWASESHEAFVRAVFDPVVREQIAQALSKSRSTQS